MINTIFWLSWVGLFYECMNIENAALLLQRKAGQDVYYSMCCFFILHRFTWWIRQCVWARVKKRDPERLLIVCMWYSTLCQPPSHFSTHIHTSSGASGNSPLIRENWGRASLIFSDGKESVQTPVTPTTPVFTQTESWRILSLLFFSFHLAPSFCFPLAFFFVLSCSPH